ncbi:MAG: hypothetical protein GX913_08810 [Clostridiales bacterium]|nr:hypothetical protein [Clostridiales bacterium]
MEKKYRDEMQYKDKRRINWLLIKQSWSCFHKAGDFSDALGVNHNIYYNIQKGQAIDSKVVKKISNKTGISEDILNGKDLLNLEGFNDNKWKSYIKLLDQLYSIKEKKGDHKIVNDKIVKLRKDMGKRVPGELNSAKEGSIWFNINFFCMNKYKYTGTGKPDTYIKNLIKSINGVSWELVQSLEEEGLFVNYRKTIYEQNEMLKAIGIYNKHYKNK